ncbi:MAG: RNase adaptor protein RapZ, partial [Deltaproteobacteria bacterium]|nr:RNase adaptor protein RapZ [Deltaproteobacteria bacterium]
MKTKIKSIILITGYSGAGKSTALNVLEDQGYYCIRHLPLRLMHLFLEDEFQKKKPLEKIAIDLDIRDAQVLEEFKKLLHFWKKKIHSIQLIFLKSSEEVLVRRFSETRRRHPFLENGNLTQSIRKEKEILEDLIPLATTVLNTSSMNVHTLKNSLLQHLTPEKTLKLPLSILSFGFKYGIPQSCDLVFDVRFLSNPYFVPKL